MQHLPSMIGATFSQKVATTIATDYEEGDDLW